MQGKSTLPRTPQKALTLRIYSFHNVQNAYKNKYYHKRKTEQQ